MRARLSRGVDTAFTQFRVIISSFILSEHYSYYIDYLFSLLLSERPPRPPYKQLPKGLGKVQSRVALTYSYEVPTEVYPKLTASVVPGIVSVDNAY